MKIYQDVFTDEEIISDSYKMVESFGGVAVEVLAKLIAVGGEDIDIGCGNAFGGGGEEEGAAGEGVEKVLDVIDTFKYEVTAFTKADFTAYFKGYMKKVLDYLGEKKPERVDGFKAGAKELFGFIKENFDEFTFYTPKNYDTENLIIMSWYKKEEDPAPTFLYIMDGMKFYKV